MISIRLPSTLALHLTNKDSETLQSINLMIKNCDLIIPYGLFGGMIKAVNASVASLHKPPCWVCQVLCKRFDSRDGQTLALQDLAAQFQERIKDILRPAAKKRDHT